jgi:ATP-dependent Clp protease ATP-binding subunit ClpC
MTDQGEIPISNTPRVERALARASRLAREMGHEYVGTEHVLIALLEDEAGIAGQVLSRHGAGSIRQEIESTLADPAYRLPTRRVFPPGGES